MHINHLKWERKEIDAHLLIHTQISVRGFRPATLLCCFSTSLKMNVSWILSTETSTLGFMQKIKICPGLLPWANFLHDNIFSSELQFLVMWGKTVQISNVISLVLFWTWIWETCIWTSTQILDSCFLERMFSVKGVFRKGKYIYSGNMCDVKKRNM